MTNSGIISKIGCYFLLVVGVAFLGFIDYWTKIELNFFVFYFIPVSFAAFRFGLMPSIAVSVFCAGVWAGADIIGDHFYSSPAFAVWNTLIRLASFVSIGWAVSTITALLAKEQSMADKLRMSLAEVKVLKGLLPICASCKKIREDSGEWQVLEEYLEVHADTQFTHGLCPDCARAMLNEAGIPNKY